MVVVLPPPPRLPPDPRVVTWPAGKALYRIYNPAYPDFRYYGPLAQRFDHHIPASPPETGPRGVYYGAPTLACCVAEVFGDRGFIQIGAEWFAAIALERAIRLLDLRGAGATRAGTVHAISGIRDRVLTQEWSRYFYEHPDLYGAVDGLIYPAAHNGGTAVALYERASGAAPWSAARTVALAEPRVAARVQHVAARLRLPYLPPAVTSR